MFTLIAKTVPILNGRDQDGNSIFLGPQGMKIPRYLLLIFLAKSTPTFKVLGQQIDGSEYFTLYTLGKVAESFRSIKPWLTAIHYDRTKVAKRIYELVAKDGYVDIKKVAGDTLITTTLKGDELCEGLLPDLISYARLSEMAPIIKERDIAADVFRTKKGTSPSFIKENATIMMVARGLVDNISKITFKFKDELKNIEDESYNA